MGDNPPRGLRPDHLYCSKHDEWKVKTASGQFVCIVCVVEDHE